MNFFPFMLVESSLVGSFRKLFPVYLILFVLIFTSLFLVIRLGIVFSTPGDMPQNLPKVVKRKTDGRWMVKRVPSEVGASIGGGSSSTGPHGCIAMQVGCWYSLVSFLPHSESCSSQQSASKLSLTSSQLM